MSFFGYEELPRGGYLVHSPSVSVQFGIPPETIKDTMRTERGTPHIFVVMDLTFDWIKGISLAELEFPIYYNFFLKKRKTVVVCEKSQVAHIRNVLKEAVFGPANTDVSVDYPNFENPGCVPDLKKEMNYFRNGLELEDMVCFTVFSDGKADVEGMTVSKNKREGYSVSADSKNIARVPLTFDYKPSFLIGERLKEPYVPPVFGVTCLGPSHGFDPEQNTSGFIIWLNRHGIMVDPPVNSTEWLERSNVNPKLIDGIILTHCHADHDAGTFQKILEEGKITIYSTETVIKSFLKKYSALSGKRADYLRRLFSFVPVRIGRPLFIHGGKFTMSYSLHSIPTFGFRMIFQDQTFVYSSDHNNDPAVHEKLLATGVITKARYDEFRSFPWDSDVIYHESGIAPLHTPIAFLDSLSEEIRKKIVVYHIAKKDFPAVTPLRLATFGMENTLVLKSKSEHYDSTYPVLEILRHLDFLSHLDIAKAQEFLLLAKEEHFSAGDKIISKGTPGDKFYIIYLGSVSVRDTDLEKSKIYGSYEYFGEVALLTGSLRQADIYAETEVTAYTLGRDEFLSFIAGTEFESTLIRISKTRNAETWNLLSKSRFFTLCSSYQKTWLESILSPEERSASGVILPQGGSFENIYLVAEGKVTVLKDNVRVAELGPGGFIGAMHKMAANEGSEHEFRNEGRVRLFALRKADLLPFIRNNPGIVMKLSTEY